MTARFNDHESPTGSSTSAARQLGATIALSTDPPSDSKFPQAFCPLLTIEQVATLLQVSERTIRRMVSGRRMPCIRLGRQLRFDAQALSRWLQAREEG